MGCAFVCFGIGVKQAINYFLANYSLSDNLRNIIRCYLQVTDLFRIDNDYRPFLAKAGTPAYFRIDLRL